MNTTRGAVLAVLLVAILGIGLGFIGMASPMAFGVIFTAGALLVLGSLGAELIAAVLR